MFNNRPGCLLPSAIIAGVLTFLVIAGFAFFNGNNLFSAGGLNAKAGAILGGVHSHAEIGNDCAKCHPAPWDADTQASRCMRCHTDISTQIAKPSSIHGAMMANNNLACRSCHPDHRGATASLTNMIGGNFPHDSTGYSLKSHRLTKAGLAFTCQDCHTQEITHFDKAICTTCHQQINSAFMSSHTQAYGTDCRGCHDGLETISKNFDHSQSVFKLEGRHQGLTCEKCHTNARTAVNFKSQPADCAACHLKNDEHKGRFGKDCAACHKPAGWKPSTFDHNLFNFKLEGKHAQVECTECHVNNVFKGTPTACYACHQKDDHHDGKFGQDCSACHSTKAWKPATFDHNLSAFKLTGGHANVACEKCHINNVFKGTSQECSGCHANPAFHSGLFKGTACSNCHNTASWSQAKFNLPHPEPGVDHGGASCRDCHTVNLMTATCTKCHGNNVPGGGN